MIAVMDINALAVGALGALPGMGSIVCTPLWVVRSHGDVRTVLENAACSGANSRSRC